MPPVRAGFAAPFLTGAGPEASADPEGGVRLWRLRGTAEGPTGGAGPDPWDAWRHRHGYSLAGSEYRWSTLGDRPEPMEASLGREYDSLLRSVWAHWAARPGAGEVPGPGRVDLELSAPGPVAYTLSLWGAALEVRFELVRGRGDWLYEPAGPPRCSLDEAEWRRRHLHARDGRFDELMLRCATYWAEATAHLLLQDLDAKLR